MSKPILPSWGDELKDPQFWAGLVVLGLTVAGLMVGLDVLAEVLR